MSPAVAPDGLQIAYIDAGTGRTIWLVGPQGENPRAILTVGEGNSFDSICWSPAGGRLAFLEIRPDAENDFIGTVDVNTPADQTTVVRGNYLVSEQGEFTGLAWLLGDRIVFARSNPHGSKGSNLWEIPVDSTSGRATGPAAQLTDEVDVYHSDLSSTSDGKRLALLRSKFHYGIFLGRLEGAGRSLTGVEEFISEESNNWANSWTPDSKFLLFTSDRKEGATEVFRQAAINGRPEALAVSGDIQDHAVALSDGTSYLYWSWPKDEGDFPKEKTLKQLPMAGGAPVNVLDNENGKAGFGCALTAPVCVTSDELTDGLGFSLLDIGARTKKPRLQVKLAVGDGYDWDLSPDGRTLAVVHSSLSDNVVKFVTLSDGATHQASVPGWAEFEYVAWTTDGSGLYLAANLPKKAALLRLDLKGSVDVLWQSESAYYVDVPVPSPDGKRIAFTVGSPGESNAWIADQF
jgi:Tol biopolymer transport system component